MLDAGTMTEPISRLEEVDPVFTEVMGLLFGDAVDPREAYDISKKKKGIVSDRTERKLTAGLSAIGAGAGALGLAVGAKEVRRHGWKGTPKLTRALIPVEMAGLTGEVLATKILHGDVKKHPVKKMGDGSEIHALSGLKVIKRKKQDKKVSKLLSDIVLARKHGEINTDTAIDLADQLVSKIDQKAGATTVFATGVASGAYVNRRRKKKLQPQIDEAKEIAEEVKQVAKADQVDYAFTGEISKLNEDKQQAFGWCSLSTIDGKPVVDLQGDYAPIEEIEKSAYAYVTSSRIGGDMHARDGDKPKQYSDLIESFIATPEKLEQMGIPTDIAKGVPSGWWVGFQVNDADQWAMVKNKERTGFSIHGKGSKVTKMLET
jgi:hypothetical protein